MRVTEGGIELDAEFAVDLIDGRRTYADGLPQRQQRRRPRRNPQYSDALRVILARLGDRHCVITDALVVSSDALRKYPDPADRRLKRGVQFPIRIEDQDLTQLRTALTEAMRSAARDPSLGPGGNNRRRVTFWVDVPGDPPIAELAAYLAGGTPGASTAAGPGATRPRVATRGAPLTAGPAAAIHSRAQGYVADAAYRRAVELHAMGAAIAHYSGAWNVEDTSAGNPYDLVLARPGETRYVEVKGTAGLGEQINLTANEVAHARRHRGEVVLFVVHGINIDRSDPANPLATGGTTTITDPFDVDAGELRPTAFSWTRS